MATARSARVVSTTELNSQTRLLEFENADGLPLGFVGGQYIIVNSGIILPTGKVAKRAYSILSADSEQGRFCVAVRRIGDGPGSNFMHSLKAGDDVPYSGPWGQYLPDDGRPRSRTFIFATDTGISAALGLIQSVKFTPQLAGTMAIWFVESTSYFVPEDFVNECIPAGLGSFQIAIASSITALDRTEAARLIAKNELSGSAPESAFLSGDGRIVAALKDDLLTMGMPEGSIRVETFFNHITRKAPV